MVRTNTDDEIVRHVQVHAKEVHDMEVTREDALARAVPVEATIDA
jgi:predicted small metal-binding protein